jgi:hypothetical protein
LLSLFSIDCLFRRVTCLRLWLFSWHDSKNNYDT